MTRIHFPFHLPKRIWFISKHIFNCPIYYVEKFVCNEREMRFSILSFYYLCRTRIEAREERLIGNFMKATKDKWLSTSYDVDGPLFILALIPFLGGKNKWKEYR